MAINLENMTIKENLQPRLVVIGVGGAGSNAVNNMINKTLDGVEFVTANTDAQSLVSSKASRTIQLGLDLTRGLGAGAKPEVGREAAQEAIGEIRAALENCNMLFITAGMGGGTGTGAAPIIAEVAREMGILTVGVVTRPFDFEGSKRKLLADEGIRQLQENVGTLIVIPNQNLFRIANENTTFADAFHLADDVLYDGVRGITELIVVPGLINLDFADIRTVMSEMGKAMMGTGEAEGEKRAIDAAEKAISNPLLEDITMEGATQVLINITGGHDVTLHEIDKAVNRIRQEVHPDAHIHFGTAFDSELEGKLRLSVVATGIANEGVMAAKPSMGGFPNIQVKDINNIGSTSTPNAPPAIATSAPLYGGKNMAKAASSTTDVITDSQPIQHNDTLDDALHDDDMMDDNAPDFVTNDDVEQYSTSSAFDGDDTKVTAVESSSIPPSSGIADAPIAGMDDIQRDTAAIANNVMVDDSTDNGPVIAEHAQGDDGPSPLLDNAPDLFADNGMDVKHIDEAEQHNVDIIKRDDSFIASRRSLADDASDMDTYKGAEFDNMGQNKKPSSSGGLFSRFLQGDKQINDYPEKPEAISPIEQYKNDQKNLQLKIEDGGKDSKDDILSIPAFLRRQAN